jgi:hypothetical protein
VAKNERAPGMVHKNGRNSRKTWAISGPIGTGPLDQCLLHMPKISPVKKKGGLSPIIFFLAASSGAPPRADFRSKCRVLYSDSRFIFMSTNTSYALHTRNCR